MAELKKGDIICSKKSLNLLYRTYYIVKEVDENIVRYSRCPLLNIPTYIYESNISEMALLQRYAIEITGYIDLQLERNAKKIADELPFTLCIRQMSGYKELLNGVFKILSLRDRENGIQNMYEILKTPTLVDKRARYISVDGVSTNQYIEITLGRKFCIL